MFQPLWLFIVPWTKCKLLTWPIALSCYVPDTPVFLLFSPLFKLFSTSGALHMMFPLPERLCIWLLARLNFFSLYRSQLQYYLEWYHVICLSYNKIYDITYQDISWPPCLKKVFSSYHQVTLLISFIRPPEYLIILLVINMSGGAFLVVEWLRMYFAMQGTPVRSLV